MKARKGQAREEEHNKRMKKELQNVFSSCWKELDWNATTFLHFLHCVSTAMISALVGQQPSEVSASNVLVKTLSASAIKLNSPCSQKVFLKYKCVEDFCCKIIQQDKWPASCPVTAQFSVFISDSASGDS